MPYKIAPIFIAYALDLIFGDPPFRWHPVRLIGRLIAVLEKKMNTGAVNKKIAGLALLLIVAGIVVSCVWSILALAKFIHPAIHLITSVLLIYFSLSIKCLATEADKVYAALENNDLKKARQNLSMIVARDTHKLEKPEIIRATVETVAESTMDGIIAPLFYAFLGGPALAWAYKAINTLDSMVGYRNSRFIDFGMASAKIDAIANFIPAKITAFFIFIAACRPRKRFVAIKSKQMFKYLFKGPAVNSEVTEAAMAAGLEIQLGGLNFYDSVPVQKALIGENVYPLKIQHIKESIRVSYICSALAIYAGLILLLLTGRR